MIIEDAVRTVRVYIPVVDAMYGKDPVCLKGLEEAKRWRMPVYPLLEKGVALPEGFGEADVKRVIEFEDGVGSESFGLALDAMLEYVRTTLPGYFRGMH
jgi:hypothetical protein